MVRLLSQPREAPRLPPDLNRAMAQPSMLVAGRQAWHASRPRPLPLAPRCLSCAHLCANVWPPLASNPSPKRRDDMSVGIVVPLPAYTLDPAFIAKKADTVVKPPGLSSPCTMECGEGLLPA